MPRKRRIEIEGVEYPSLVAAATVLDITLSSIGTRLNSDSFPGYRYLSPPGKKQTPRAEWIEEALAVLRKAPLTTSEVEDLVDIPGGGTNQLCRLKRMGLVDRILKRDPLTRFAHRRAIWFVPGETPGFIDWEPPD